MGKEIYTFKDLLALLPEGWQAKAKELGAFERAREVKSPEDLPRLIFLYLTEGRSFAGTSALVHLSGDMHLSKTAVYNRTGNSGEWNNYIIVVTSPGAEVSASSMLELYRARWQIELVFKRLKSLLGYNGIPMKVEGNINAWFYGKLLLATLCELVVGRRE
jgi:hypothetical protein